MTEYVDCVIICYNTLYGAILMSFSEKVKFVRGRLYLTQKQLADELGVSFATINRWESKKQEPQFLLKKRFDEFCRQKSISFDD